MTRAQQESISNSFKSSSSATSGQGVATAVKNAQNMTASWDKYAKATLEGYMDRYSPAWRSNMAAMGTDLNTYLGSALPSILNGEQSAYKALQAIGQQFMIGAIPADVTARRRRNSAQTAAVTGIGGQRATNVTARDLGLTSLQIKQQGADLLTKASAVAGNIGTLVSGAVDSNNKYQAMVGTIAGANLLTSKDFMDTANSLIDQFTLSAKDTAGLSIKAQELALQKASQDWGMKVDQYTAGLEQIKMQNDAKIGQNVLNAYGSGKPLSGALIPTITPFGGTNAATSKLSLF